MPLSPMGLTEERVNRVRQLPSTGCPWRVMIGGEGLSTEKWFSIDPLGWTPHSRPYLVSTEASTS